MRKKRIPLTRSQKELMSEFYGNPATQVVFKKQERDDIWNSIKNGQPVPSKYNFDKCPALLCEIQKSIKKKGNIQSTVFSECVFAQTLANMFGLNCFFDYSNCKFILPTGIIDLLKSYNLKARYCYTDSENKRILIQAGGPGGVDGALFTVIDNNVFTIEFKEPGAKTTEADLPKYDEDGKLISTEKFEKKHSQFIPMLSEHIGFSVWENIGHNENAFLPENVIHAVSENYASKKFADVICTEDINNNLVMLPANQVSLWAKLSGEIRTAGRNHYKVWTPIKLKNIITEIGGIITGNYISLNKDVLKTRNPRGGTGITGYKINQLFFIKNNHYTITKNIISFDINQVRQLCPTITAKMFFIDLDFNNVLSHYKADL